MYLYHFTDTRNLESIRDHGLLSWDILETLGIPHVPGSSPESRYYDARKGLHNYVRLCLRPNHPMAYICEREGRIQQLAWLRIDASVMEKSSTLYSDDNAVKNQVRIGYDPMLALQSTSRQAEIMVLAEVPPELIHFPSIFGVRLHG